MYVELFKLAPLPPIEFIGTQADLSSSAPRSAAVEEKEQRALLLISGYSVKVDQALGSTINAQFFLEFPPARVSGGFAAFDIAASNVPGVPLRGVDKQYAAVIIEEQAPSGDARGREGRASVGHPPEGKG
jgi:hypothetical protein